MSYQAFLSHNSADKPAVEELARRLEQAGLSTYLDKWRLIPGESWQPALEEALDTAESCVVFIGPSGLGPWQHEEVQAAISRRVADPNHTFRVVPVLLPGAEREQRSKLPTFLSSATWVEFSGHTLDDDEAFHRLTCGIRGIEPGPAPGEAVYEGLCPYRGLQVFDIDHAQFFFGRDAEVDWMVERLAKGFGNVKEENRFLGVVGASGSGKSSLVRAGLIPALQTGRSRQGKGLPGSAEWPIAILRPGSEPLKALADALWASDVAKPVIPDPLGFADQLKADQRRLHGIVGTALHGSPQDRRFVVVVDQFEELFTQLEARLAESPDDPRKQEQIEGERRAFIDNLLYAATVRGGRTLAIITMRADFYGKCSRYEDLAHALADEQELVPPLDETNLRAAIEQPAQRCGLELESGLVDLLLQDMREQPAGALPLLQHTLFMLWGRRSGRCLTVQAYRDIGEIEGALEAHANNIYQNELDSDEQREICKRILLMLTSPGQGTEDTRRRIPRSQLGESEFVDEVLQALTTGRLITLSETDPPQVEVTHEALIRGWGELRKWIDADRESLRTLHQLLDAAEHWAQHDRDAAYLYTGSRLLQAEEWAEANSQQLADLPRAQDFIAAGRERERESAKERERLEREAREAEERRLREQAEAAEALAAEQQARAQKTRRLLTWVSVAAVLAMVACVVAFVSQRQAQEAQQTAEEAKNEAVAEKNNAEDQTKIANEQQLLAEKEKANAVKQQHRAEKLLYVSQVRFAADACERGDAREAWRNLNAAQWNLRAWEHDYLYMLYTRFTRARTTLKGHSEAVSSVSFSPDGERIVSSSGDETVKVWNAQTGQNTLTLKGHSGWVASVDFSPDGKRIVSGSRDTTLKVWDAETSREPLTFEGHSEAVTSVSFSPDGKRIVSGGVDKTVRIWDAETSRELLTLTEHSEAVTSVSFSPDGKRVVSGSQDMTVRIWDAETGRETRTLGRHSDDVTSVSFSPDGERIASGSEDGTGKMWDAETGREILTLRGHSRGVTSVSFSPDGDRIVSGSWDETVRTWDARTGHETLTLKEDSGGVTSVGFSPDGKRIVSGSNGNALDYRPGEVKVWDAQTGQESLTLKGHLKTVNSVSFSPDGGRIVSGGDITVKVWDAESGQRTLTLDGHTYEVTSVSFSPDGERIVSGSSGDVFRNKPGVVMLWDLRTGQRTLTLDRHSSTVSSVSFSPDGERIASGSWDKTVKVWDAETGQEMLNLKPHSGHVNAVAFSPDGERIASGSGSGDGAVRVWDAETGQKTLTFKGHSDGVTSVSFSPDGKRIVSGSGDSLFHKPGEVKVWDAETGQEMLTLRGHSEPVSSVSFSPDGERIVSGSWDKTMKVWDAETGLEALTLKGHLHCVTSMSLSPDGRRIASGSMDETVKVWDAGTGQETLTLTGHSDSAISVSFSPDGERIVSGSSDRTVKVWDAETGQETLTLTGHSDVVWSVSFSPDGERIVSGSGQRNEDGLPTEIRVWDAVTGKPTRACDGDHDTLRADDSDTWGRRIVTAEDRSLFIRDAETGDELFSAVDDGEVFSPRFSPDGTRIVSGCADGTVKVWLQAARSAPAVIEVPGTP